MKKIKKLIILFILLLTLQVNATDWYVAKTGNDANDGSSWQEAKLTISAMVTASSNGDTIYIGTGTYDEEVDLDTANKSITLDGVDKTASIARTGDGEKGITLEDDTTIRNLTVSTTSKNGGTYGIYGTGKDSIAIENCDIFGGTDGILLANCNQIFISNSSISSNYDGINYQTSTEIHIADSSISTDGTFGVSAANSAIIGTSTGTCTNCSITSTRDDVSSTPNYGIRHGGVLVFTNCLITVSAGSNNTGDVKGIYSSAAAARTVADNCTITTSTSGSGTAYDLYNSAGTIYIVDSSYDRNKVYGKIFEGSRQRRRYDLLDSSVR